MFCYIKIIYFFPASFIPQKIIKLISIKVNTSLDCFVKPDSHARKSGFGSLVGERFESLELFCRPCEHQGFNLNNAKTKTDVFTWTTK